MIHLSIPTIAADEKSVVTHTQAQAEKPDLKIDASATARLRQLMHEHNRPQLKLRIRIRGGGCSGFQYSFDLTDTANDDDHLWQQDTTCIIVDPLSQQMLNGARLEYFHTPMESGFRLENPHVKSHCGCGVSFSV